MFLRKKCTIHFIFNFWISRRAFLKIRNTNFYNLCLPEKKKRTTHVRAMSWFGVLLRTVARDTASRVTLRNRGTDGGGRSVCMWCWWRGMCSQAHVSVPGVCWPPGAGILVNGFSAFPTGGRCKNPGSSEFPNYLRACANIFFIPDLHSEFFPGCIEGQQLQGLND